MSAVTAQKRMNRFRYYRSFMEGKEYMLLRDIQKITGRKVSFLQKDLSRMIRERLFLQANMNREGTCLFLTNSAFIRYQRGHLIIGGPKEADARANAAKRQEEQGESLNFDGEQACKEQSDDKEGFSQRYEQAANVQKNQEPRWSAELQAINAMIGRIHDPAIIKPVSDICIRGQQMIYFKDTNVGSMVGRFLNYYLPITDTVLRTYLELEKEGLEDQAGDLAVILNTIQHSFDQSVEKLIEGKRLDVEEDIAAMEIMLSSQYR